MPVLLVAAAAVLGTAATLLSQLSLGLERTVAWSLRYPLENAIIVAGALALYPRAGLNGAIAAIALGAGAAFVLGLCTAGPALRGARQGVALPAGVLRFARLQAASGALTQVVHRGVAPACALAGAGAVATGHAALAAGAALAITYAVLQTMLVGLPGASRAHARDPASAEAALRRTALWCAWAAVPVCGGVALAAEPLLAATLGEQFRPAADALRIALAGAALAPLWALANLLAAVREQPAAIFAGAAAGATAFVLVALLAVPPTGAERRCGGDAGRSRDDDRRDVRGAAQAPMISVVVPTCDRPAALGRCLAALARQRTPQPLEVVVVNDGRADVEAAGARVIGAAGAGPAAARNLGAQAARGSVVCFTDDDCAPGPDWAARLAVACAGGGAAAGITIADPAAGSAAAAAQLLTNTLMATSVDAITGGLRFAPTCNLACHADTLAALPFDESFALAGGEDRDWCARLVEGGAVLRHVADAVVVHRPQLGVGGLVRQQLRYGRGAVGFRAAGGSLAGARFYRELARASARAGAGTASLVALAQVAVAAGAASELLQQRLAR